MWKKIQSLWEMLVCEKNSWYEKWNRRVEKYRCMWIFYWITLDII